MRQRPDALTHPPRPEEGATQEPTLQLCAFFVGSEEYAIDIMRVEEVLPPQHITPIRGAPSIIEGVLRLRGVILPVVDLRKCLLGRDVPVSSRTRLLVCFLGRRRVVFCVDRVSEVIRLRLSDIKPAPSLGPEGPAPFVVGVCGPAERLTLLLDLKALLISELERESGRGRRG